MQQRGATIIKARGASSAASAANAVVDSVGSIINPTAGGDYHSVCLCSDGSYSVDEGLISSFPVRNVAGQFDIVQGVKLNAFSQGKLDATVSELREAREMVKDLLPD